jgi:XTP/dITP diphosphohydrolase
MDEIQQLLYITGNKSKFEHAKEVLKAYNIDLVQQSEKFDEIQSDSVEEIAIDKAQKAFEIIKKPLFINDAGWIIPSLNGFPGPYMKFVNKWFTSQDFLNLMQDKTDRRIIFRQLLVYTDGKKTKTFVDDQEGEILMKEQGENGESSDKIITFVPEKYTIAQMREMNIKRDTKNNLWKEFALWVQASR